MTRCLLYAAVVNKSVTGLQPCIALVAYTWLWATDLADVCRTDVLYDRRSHLPCVTESYCEQVIAVKSHAMFDSGRQNCRQQEW